MNEINISPLERRLHKLNIPCTCPRDRRTQSQIKSDVAMPSNRRTRYFSPGVLEHPRREFLKHQGDRDQLFIFEFWRNFRRILVSCMLGEFGIVRDTHTDSIALFQESVPMRADPRRPQ